MHIDLRLSQLPERQSLDQWLLQWQSRCSIDIDLVRELIVARKHIHQHLPVRGGGGEPGEGLVPGTTDLPENQIGRGVDVPAIEQELAGYVVLAAFASRVDAEGCVFRFFGRDSRVHVRSNSFLTCHVVVLVGRKSEYARVALE